MNLKSAIISLAALFVLERVYENGIFETRS